MFYWSLLSLAFSILRVIDGHELRYALFTAGPTRSFDSSGAVPAIELAEEMINADSSILPGYNLTHTTVFDTMCDRAIALDGYFNAISPRRPAILGLLGCGCSVASEPVAEIIHHNSISQVSYASPSIELSDRQHFPNFFRTYPSDADLPAAVVALIQEYGWRRVAFITQEDSLFAETLIEAVTEQGIETMSRVNSRAELLQDLNDPDKDFFCEDEDFRVFFLNTDSKTARQIVCEAYLRGFTYPKYAWFTNGWYQSNWWTEEVNPEPIDCSDDQLAQFLHRSLAFEKSPEQNHSTTLTDVVLTLNMFDILYQERLNEEQHNNSFYSPSFVATVAYDALWAFALALNKTNEMVQSLTRNEILSTTQCEGSDEEFGIHWDTVPLENFDYSNQLMGCIVKWNLERTDFVGVSGHVSFDGTGSRVQSQVGVYQYRLVDNSINRLAIADIQRVNDTLSAFTYKINHSDQTVYPNSEGGVPPDGTPVTVVVTFHLALVGTYYTLATAGLVFTTICLIFNFTQRKKKVIRLNSPNLNYFAILGSYVMNISIFFRIMPSTDLTVNAARCNLDILLNTIGYCLAYGAILAKMGRIYYIFNDPTTSKKTLKDWHLALVVLVITAVGAVLAGLQVSVPNLQPQPYPAQNNEPHNIPMNELGLRINDTALFCFNSILRPAASAWLSVTFSYLAILQLIGVFLALRTRKVKIRALRDSKFIVTAIFLSTIALLTIAASTFAIRNLPNVIEMLVTGSIIAVTAATLALVFIPKMVSLYQDPKGDNVFERPHSQSSSPDTCVVATNISAFRTEDQTRVMELESKVIELEQALQEHRGVSTKQDPMVTITVSNNTKVLHVDPSRAEERQFTQVNGVAESGTAHCVETVYKNGWTRNSSGDDI